MTEKSKAKIEIFSVNKSIVSLTSNLADFTRILGDAR
jgi:hypothetical protein